jgi:hypothetical protein
MWAADDGESRYRSILEWVAGLPFAVRIRIQTLGEPFVSQSFLRGAAWLSHQSNLRFVEVVSNGSFRRSQFEGWARACDIGKISLWLTYHPGQIEPEEIVASARLAQASGAFAVVHSLLFPGGRDAIERLADLCRKDNIRTEVTIGHNYNGAFASAGAIPIVETEPQQLVALYRDEAALRATLTANVRPKGQPCSAGHDYIRIYPDGFVYPCGPYRGLPEARMGSALDPGFVPALRVEPYADCAWEGPCRCKEDYFHLAIARENLRFPRSLGYYERDTDRIVHIGDRPLNVDLMVR